MVEIIEGILGFLFFALFEVNRGSISSNSPYGCFALVLRKRHL